MCIRDSDKVVDAEYWLGRILFMQKKYSQAALAFAEFNAKYPDDKRYEQISLLIAAMYGLVVANSFLLMFIFWELMGVCSYLLIGFWYEKPSAASAAKKAFLVTRVGDVFLLLGLVILYNTFGTLRYSELFADPQILMANLEEVKWATLCLFGGSVGKSAQFPLHVWLPDVCSDSNQAINQNHIQKALSKTKLVITNVGP